MRPSWHLLALCLCFAVGGCQAATISVGDPDAGGGGETGRELFDRSVASLISGRCGSCHSDGGRAGAPFVSPADLYGAVLTYPGLVTPGEPARSLLLTKGAHDGPAWETAEADVISRWITLEGAAPPMIDAGMMTMPVETAQFTPMEGDNAVRLDGVDLPGAELRFTLNVRATEVQISSIRIYAGGASVAIRSPLFIAWDGTTEIPDADNPFEGMPLTVAGGGGESYFVPSTAVVLEAFPAGGKISVRFQVAVSG
jgi:mono/diheme cytochrome c family protein